MTRRSRVDALIESIDEDDLDDVDELGIEDDDVTEEEPDEDEDFQGLNG